MAQVRFLVDESLPKRLVIAVLHRNAAIDILRVGQPGAPALEANDAEIVAYAEGHQRLLLTADVRTLRKVVADHLDAGHHTWGTCYVSQDLPFGQMAYEVEPNWSVTDATEWIDNEGWIP
jgi:hypothetical protein